MAASESTGSTGIVAIFSIVLMLVIAGFVAWRAGVFGDASDHELLEIRVQTPSSR